MIFAVRKDAPAATDVHVDAILKPRKRKKKVRDLGVDNTSAMACSLLPIVKGDVAGHEFHGNQWQKIPDLTFESKTSKHLSRIDARTPEASAMRLKAGYLIWDATGEIQHVGVHKKYQRMGLATEMLRRAREINPNVHHSDVLTPDGKAWSAVIKGDVAGHTFHGNQYVDIGSEGARGNSREVTHEEFQALAHEGKQRLDEMTANASSPDGLDRNWHQLVAKSYSAAMQSWGGVTIDAHSGQILDSAGEERYALTARDPSHTTISIPENSDTDHFANAMQAARKQFDGELSRENFALGVFHDDDNQRIDFDPVLVLDNLHDVETIGAYTHAIGGAYNFADGNGYWPPHVADAADEHKKVPAMAKAKMSLAQFLAQSRDPNRPLWQPGGNASLAEAPVARIPIGKPVEKSRRTGRSAFPIVRKGEHEDHAFRGNQWTGGKPGLTLADPVAGVHAKPKDKDARITGVGMTEFPPKFLERMNTKAKSLGVSSDSILGNFEKLFQGHALVDGMHGQNAMKDARWYHDLNKDVTKLAQKLGAKPDAVGAAVSAMASHREWNKNLKDATALFEIVHKNEPFEVSQKVVDDFVKHQMSGRIKHPDRIVNPDGTPLKAGTMTPKTANPWLTVIADPNVKAANVIGQTGVDPPARAVALAQGTMTPEQAVQGVKLRSFYNNMMDPMDDRFATIDTWMFRAGVDPKQTFHTTWNGQLGDYTLAEYERMYQKTGKDGKPVFKPDGSPHSLKRAPQNLFQASPGAMKVKGEEVFPSNVGLYPLFHDAVNRGAALHTIDAKGRVDSEADPKTARPMLPHEYQAIVWYAIKDAWIPAEGGRNVSTKDYVKTL